MAVENIKNVTLQENQLQIYEQHNECTTPEIILQEALKYFATLN